MSDKSYEVFTKVLKDESITDVTEKVRKAFRESNIQFLKEMNMEWKVRCILGLIAKLKEEHEDASINFELINEILGEVDQYDFNDFEEVKTVEDLQNILWNVVEASVMDGNWRVCTCKKCKNKFHLSYKKTMWFEKKGFPIPKTCDYCKKGIERPIPKKEVKKEEVVEEHVPTTMELALKKANVLK